MLCIRKRLLRSLGKEARAMQERKKRRIRAGVLALDSGVPGVLWMDGDPGRNALGYGGLLDHGVGPGAAWGGDLCRRDAGCSDTGQRWTMGRGVPPVSLGPGTSGSRFVSWRRCCSWPSVHFMRLAGPDSCPCGLTGGGSSWTWWQRWSAAVQAFGSTGKTSRLKNHSMGRPEFLRASFLRGKRPGT